MIVNYFTNIESVIALPCCPSSCHILRRIHLSIFGLHAHPRGFNNAPDVFYVFAAVLSQYQRRNDPSQPDRSLNSIGAHIHSCPCYPASAYNLQPRWMHFWQKVDVPRFAFILSHPIASLFSPPFPSAMAVTPLRNPGQRPRLLRRPAPKFALQHPHLTPPE